jgi:hypothetical protein
VDGHAVRVAARVEDAENDELFELTEHGANVCETMSSI